MPNCMNSSHQQLLSTCMYFGLTARRRQFKVSLIYLSPRSLGVKASPLFLCFFSNSSTVYPFTVPSIWNTFSLLEHKTELLINCAETWILKKSMNFKSMSPNKFEVKSVWTIIVLQMSLDSQLHLIHRPFISPTEF